MIIADIHSHILPGTDDGARNINASLEMLKIAYQSGVRHIAATPHFGGQRFFAQTGEIDELIQILSYELFMIDMNIKIYPGMEVLFTEETVSDFEAGYLKTLGHNGFLLLEFPFSQQIPNLLDMLLYTQSATQTRIIIAHPERYEYMRSHPEITDMLVKNGFLLQLNADSLRGNAGKEAQKSAGRLLERRQVHFIASDAHDPVRRTPHLKDIYDNIYSKYGEEAAKKLFYENALAVLNGRAPSDTF